ncbi:2OG-Fe(II) oxygenase [Paucibacter sp. TC2R-5]|uniref:2OG-Fe(II) oxygenase n=1 Tax=Paucibacter sp. TC2R-5 TaxID=2893555 RepID=UPI0021E51354|nr:2OG-Fe(II) oxygenase [Paucibacter sp. TC2R-5]MCV2358013.1 2OG-Fe(II) oxygenase [Paucibacter sp. TC2R-5]
MSAHHNQSIQQQAISPELRVWIQEQLAQGFTRAQLLDAMKSSGWQEDLAARALDESRADSDVQVPAELQIASKVPELDLSGGQPTLWIDGHEVKVLMSITQPRVVVLGGLLSDAECDAMVAAASARLARSETVATTPGGSEINPARTSDGMFFERGESELIRTIESRLAKLLNWPIDHGEGLQVLRYRPGAEYLPHYDYFDPTMDGAAAILKRGGQRVGTLVMYLNTPQAGGATIFPDIKLDVSPVKGNAVFFSYDRPHPQTQSLHGGAPVREGEKWVATKWLRAGVFV